MRKEMLKGLKAFNNKKSATIDKLKKDIDHLKHKLHGRDDMVKYLKDEVEVERRENNVAFERARLAHQNAESLQNHLKKEQIEHEKLRQEATRAALEAERQRFEIVEDYHNGTLRKVEVALACEAGFDYLSMQLPAELKADPERFHYPPRVANYLGAPQMIERKGWGLVLSARSGDENDEESAQGIDEGVAHDSGVSLLEEEGGEEVRSELQLTLPPTSTAIAPLRSTSTFGPSIAPPRRTQSSNVAPSLNLAPFPSLTP